MEHEARLPEHRSQERRKRSRRFLELAEDEDFLLPCSDDLREVAQTCELAAVTFGPYTLAEPLRRMVADLLQSHEECEHQSPAFHSIDLLKLLAKIVHRLLIERCLLAAKRAEGLDLGLLR